MDIVKLIVEMIDDEVEGAENYARQAVAQKDENPSLAKVFFDLSVTELQHIDLLHSEVVSLIKRLKDKGTVIPDPMLAVYNFLHEKTVNEVVAIKGIQSIYRG